MYYTLYLFCIYSNNVFILYLFCIYTHSMRKDGDINWTEHQSSLKHHVRSNVKHKTKETAPGQTAAQVKSE